jgi:hypothetical protein
MMLEAGEKIERQFESGLPKSSVIIHVDENDFGLGESLCTDADNF